MDPGVHTEDSAGHVDYEQLLKLCDNQEGRHEQLRAGAAPAFAGQGAQRAQSTPSRSKVKAADGYVEPNSRLLVSRPLTPSAVLRERLLQAPFVALSTFLSSNGNQSKPFTIIAAVSRKSKPMQSSSGSSYSHWALTTLDGTEARLMLFGDAHRCLWKAHGYEGSVVAVTSPELKPSRTDRNESPILNICNSNAVYKLGECREIAYCQGTCKDGTKCNNAIPQGKIQYCKYHVMSALKNMRRSVPQASGSNLQLSMQQHFQQQQQKHKRQNRKMDVFVSDGIGRGGRRSTRGVSKPSVNQLQKCAESARHETSRRQAQQLVSSKRQQEDAAPDTKTGEKRAKYHECPKVKESTSVTLNAEEEDELDACSAIEQALQERPPSDPNATRFEPQQLSLHPSNPPASHVGRTGARPEDGNHCARTTETAEKEDRRPGRLNASLDVESASTHCRSGARSTANERWNFTAKFGSKVSESLKNWKPLNGTGAELEDLQLQRYLNNMEKYEAADQYAKSKHCIHVTGYRCKDCNTSWSENKPKVCSGRGHEIPQLKMNKRFFSCAACGFHISILRQAMPTHACERCGDMRWNKAGMKRAASNSPLLSDTLQTCDPNSTAEAIQRASRISNDEASELTRRALS